MYSKPAWSSFSMRNVDFPRNFVQSMNQIFWMFFLWKHSETPAKKSSSDLSSNVPFRQYRSSRGTCVTIMKRIRSCGTLAFTGTPWSKRGRVSAVWTWLCKAMEGIFDCCKESCGAPGSEMDAACGFLACDQSTSRLSLRDIGLLLSLDCPNTLRPCSRISADLGADMFVGDILEPPWVSLNCDDWLCLDSVDGRTPPGRSTLFTIRDSSSLSCTSEQWDRRSFLDGAESLQDTPILAEAPLFRFRWRRSSSRSLSLNPSVSTRRRVIVMGGETQSPCLLLFFNAADSWVSLAGDRRRSNWVNFSFRTLQDLVRVIRVSLGNSATYPTWFLARQLFIAVVRDIPVVSALFCWVWLLRLAVIGVFIILRFGLRGCIWICKWRR